MSAFSDSGRQRLKEPLVGFYRLIAHSRPWPLQDDKELERLLMPAQGNPNGDPRRPIFQTILDRTTHGICSEAACRAMR